MKRFLRSIHTLQFIPFFVAGLTLATMPAHGETILNFFSGSIAVMNGDISPFFTAGGTPLPGVCVQLDASPPGEIPDAPPGSTLGLNESPSSGGSTKDGRLHPSGFNQRRIMSAYNPNIFGGTVYIGVDLPGGTGTNGNIKFNNGSYGGLGVNAVTNQVAPFDADGNGHPDNIGLDAAMMPISACAGVPTDVWSCMNQSDGAIDDPRIGTDIGAREFYEAALFFGDGTQIAVGFIVRSSTLPGQADLTITQPLGKTFGARVSSNTGGTGIPQGFDVVFAVTNVNANVPECARLTQVLNVTSGSNSDGSGQGEDFNLLQCVYQVPPFLLIDSFCPSTNAVPGSILVFSGIVRNFSNFEVTNVFVFNNQPAPFTPVVYFPSLFPGEARFFAGSYLVPRNYGGTHLANTLTVVGTSACGTNAFGFNTTLVCAIDPLVPPSISRHPGSTNVPPGSAVMFCVQAAGSLPLTYQWRLNGVNIPGQTNTCITLPSVGVTNGGSYTVVVANDVGIVTSDNALVTVEGPVTPGGDNFAERVALEGLSGFALGSNRSATSEPGEPRHAGKPGGNSIWYKWRAPATGIAIFRTTGSSFDSLLGIYTGLTVSNLFEVAADEDSGGFLTSALQFNAVAETDYAIAMDGFGGQAGDLVLTWQLQIGPAQVPVIVMQPQSQTVGPGSNYTFIVTATGTGLSYQWFFNGQILTNQTSPSLTIVDVREPKLGQYLVRVTAGDPFVDSIPASLQINVTGQEVQPVLLVDKFLDAVTFGEPLRLGGSGLGGGQPGPFVGPTNRVAGTLARGYSGTQVFETFGAQSQAGEPNHCGIAGGASSWFTYLADEPGQLYLNTDGSTFNTVLAVYTGDGTSFSNLQALACNNDGGGDGRDSSVNFLTQSGTKYFIAVDGVQAATGLLQLNFTLVTPSRLTPLGIDMLGRYRFRLTGRANMKFILQSSPTLSIWSNLLTNNSPTEIFEFVDVGSVGTSRRYYRALMLP